MISQESEINRRHPQQNPEGSSEDSEAVRGARRLGKYWLQDRAGWLARSVATFVGLVQVAILRLRYHSGLSLLALIGIILAVGLTASAGFFAQAVDQVMMDRELAEYTRITGKRPFSARVFAASSPSVPLSIERAETLGEHVGDTVSSEVGLPIAMQTMLTDSGVMQLKPPPDDARYATTTSTRSLGSVALVYLQNVESYISIEGDASLSEGASQGSLDVWMSAILGAEIGAQVGDIYHLSANALAGDLPIRIAGFWEPLDPADAYWPIDPNTSLVDKLLVRRSDYIQVVEPLLQVKVRAVTWQIILDEDAALPARARNYKEGFERAAGIIARYLPDARLTAPTGTLEKFVGQQTALTTLLLGFNIPALGFLLYFLVLTSAVIAYWQRRETSLLRSRGISRISIFNFTVVEAMLLFLVGCPLGLLFGILLARGMGYAASFLTFDWRPPLPVSHNGFNLVLTASTLGVVLVAKIWPVMASARETVVTQAREHSRPTQGPFWYRNYLDLILLVPAFYGYQQLSRAGWLGALTRERPEDLYQDPLLVLVPGLFVVASALVMMRIFPLVMRLIDLAARHAPWLTVYLSFRQLGRQSHAYINPLLLVIVSLALGVYTLSMAASLDRWLADRIYYSIGADLSFQPYSESIAMSEAAVGSGADWIPPVDEFGALPGVAAATRIGDYRAEINLAGASARRIPARFLGIDRVDFPATAWWRRDFARESLGALMNRLALVPDGILVSQEFLTRNELNIGDRISLLVIPDFGLSVRDTFTIVGVYEYFPTVYASQITVIGNLEYIFSYFGVNMPHNIWMRLEPDASGAEVVESIPATGVDSIREQVAQTLLIEEQARMERVGVFGTLTVSFIAAALMAALGLLTYSYASLNERLYQFSVLRAIGLRRVEIVMQIGLEYLILTAYGAAAGVLCGTLAAELFVPMFRAGTGENAPLPPLLPIIAHSEILPLAAAFTAVMVILEIFIISSAFFRRLFEALRLGHHG